jgi:hypothetical protein
MSGGTSTMAMGGYGLNYKPPVSSYKPSNPETSALTKQYLTGTTSFTQNPLPKYPQLHFSPSKQDDNLCLFFFFFYLFFFFSFWIPFCSTFKEKFFHKHIIQYSLFSFFSKQFLGVQNIGSEFGTANFQMKVSLMHFDFL